MHGCQVEAYLRVEDMDCGPAGQRGIEVHHMCVKPECGISARAVGGAQPDKVAVGCHEVRYVPLGECDPFGLSGRAGSIEYHHVGFRLGIAYRAVVSPFRIQKPGCGNDCAGKIGHCLLCKSVVFYYQAQAGIFRHKRKPVLREVRVERHVGSPGFHYCQWQDCHQFGAVD